MHTCIWLLQWEVPHHTKSTSHFTAVETFTFSQRQTHKHTQMYIYMCTQALATSRTNTHTNMHAYTHTSTSMYTRIHTCLHTHIPTYIPTHTHTHTHAHREMLGLHYTLIRHEDEHTDKITNLTDGLKQY